MNAWELINSEHEVVRSSSWSEYSVNQMEFTFRDHDKPEGRLFDPGLWPGYQIHTTHRVIKYKDH